MRYTIWILGLVAVAAFAAEPQPDSPATSTETETILRSPSVRPITPPRMYRFVPQGDITSDELARLKPYIAGKPLPEDDQKALGSAMRHLRELP